MLGTLLCFLSLPPDSKKVMAHGMITNLVASIYGSLEVL
jgi:hypothetical protein